MIHFATHDLINLINTYGYWAVLLFVAIESTGIPFPGETMLLAASITAGTSHQLNIWLVIAAAAAGAILGDAGLASAMARAAALRAASYTWTVAAGRLRRLYGDLTARALVECH